MRVYKVTYEAEMSYPLIQYCAMLSAKDLLDAVKKSEEYLMINNLTYRQIAVQEMPDE